MFMETNSEIGKETTTSKPNGFGIGCIVYIIVFIGLFALAYYVKEYLS